MEVYGTIWVCQDCMLHQANGECGSCPGRYGHDKRPLSSIGDGFSVALGMLYEEHSCGDGLPDPRIECDCETDSFSMSQCQGCGSYLHGERHAMTLFKD